MTPVDTPFPEDGNGDGNRDGDVNGDGSGDGDADGNAGGNVLGCDDCGYEAPAVKGDWIIEDADRPRMGAPMIVLECPECGSVLDIRPVY